MTPREIKERYALLREQAISGRISKTRYDLELAELKKAAEEIKAASSSAQPAAARKNEPEYTMPAANVTAEIPRTKTSGSLRDAINEADRSIDREEARQQADEMRERRRVGKDRRVSGIADRRDPLKQIGVPRGTAERRSNIFPDRRESYYPDRRNPTPISPSQTPANTTKTVDSRNAKTGAPTIAVGRPLGGRYTLITRLSVKTTGELWRAFDQQEGEDVLLRFLPPVFRGSQTALTSIRDTIRQVQTIKAAGINPVLRFHDDPEEPPHFISAQMDGIPLDKHYGKYMAENAKFPIQELGRILLPIAEALDAAHSRRLMHGEIRTENIMVTPSGGRLLDFGLEAVIRKNLEILRKSGRLEQESEKEQAKRMAYQAPESLEGRSPLHASDQYSLAVVAFELLDGRLPFRTQKPSVLRECILNESIPAIPDRSAMINAAFAMALEKEPDDRFDSCTELLSALGCESNPVAAAPLSIHGAGIRDHQPESEETAITGIPREDRKAFRSIASTASAEDSIQRKATIKRTRKWKSVYNISTLLAIIVCIVVIYFKRERVSIAWQYYILGKSLEEINGNNGGGPPPGNQVAANETNTGENPAPTTVSSNHPASGPIALRVMGSDGVGEKFVFVIDRTSSMGGTGSTPLKLVQAELPKAFVVIGEERKFQMILFGSGVTPALGMSLVPADNSNVQKAASLLRQASPQGEGTPYDALLEAFKQKPDAVFLVVSNSSKPLGDSQIAAIRQMARLVPINVVEIGSGPKPAVTSQAAKLTLVNKARYYWVDMNLIAARSPAITPPPITPANAYLNRRVDMNRSEIDGVESLAKKIYESGLGKNPLKPDAVRTITAGEQFNATIKASKSGLPAAQYIEGICTLNGVASEHNAEQGFNLLKQSADSGCAPAMHACAELYLLGTGTEKNSLEALAYFKKAAEAGEPAAQYRLSQILQNPDERKKWLLLSAELGFPDAVKALQTTEK